MPTRFWTVPLLLASLALLSWSIRWIAATEDSLGFITSEASHYLVRRRAELNPWDDANWVALARTTAGMYAPGGKLAPVTAQSQTAAVEFYRHAIRLRPYSGYLWLQYAEFGSKLAEPIQKTMGRLDRALYFAPVSSYVRLASLRIWLVNWDKLTTLQQKKVIESIRNTLLHDPQNVVRIAVEHDWSEELRPLLQKESNVTLLARALATKEKSIAADR